MFKLIICPSTQVPRIYCAKHLKPLNEGVDEGWNSAIPIYLVTVLVHSLVVFWGLENLHSRRIESKKRAPFVGVVTDTFRSHVIATWQMYLPFLTCGVKYGAVALNNTNGQNVHSITPNLARLGRANVLE